MSKVAVFSDGLDFIRALEIARYFENKIKVVFGIGTNLTNDFGSETLQIVIKMTRCNGQPVAKVSDSPGKSMCEDESYVRYLREVFQIKGNNI
jgi:nicotinate phosphoribosyltransferase